MPEEQKDIHYFLKQTPLIIGGPCSVESKEQIAKIASSLKSFGLKFLRGGTFKPRTSPQSFQGIGELGIKFLKEAAEANDMFAVTEVLESHQLDNYYDMIDVIQVGSRSMTSYGFLKYIGKISSKDKKPVILKRGFQATLKELLYAADYILQEGNPNVILCLRGIRTFEQIDSQLRFTPDLAGIAELKEMSDLKIFFDPSHSTGNAMFVPAISKAALGLGAHGLLIECHYAPEEAFSDAKQTINYREMKGIIDYANNFQPV